MTDLPILKSFLSERVIVLLGDITMQRVDAVVNAANRSLLGGGGVDGAIHSSGGPRILEECREIRRRRFPDGLPTGEAVLTIGGDLAARYVIHTVGPMRGPDPTRDAELLAACYRNSLALAGENCLCSIAFPAISTGIFGYPRDEAARVASETIESVLTKDTPVNEVRLVFFESLDARVFLQHHRFSVG
jgi:O-acetyl-ADP-ribose deacetylase